MEEPINIFQIDYNPALCNELLEHCSRGVSRESWVYARRVSPRLIKEWCKDHEEFGDAWHLALYSQYNYWETLMFEDIDSIDQALKMMGKIEKIIQAITPPEDEKLPPPEPETVAFPPPLSEEETKLSPVVSDVEKRSTLLSFDRNLDILKKERETWQTKSKQPKSL